MSQAMREQINGNTPQDIMKVNENFEAIWYKLHGDVDFADTNNKLKNRIQTQYIPVQGEGNFDVNYPLYVRFYVPPNTKEIKSSSFNAICENYRMDSGVAEGGGGVENVDLNISMGGSNVNLTLESKAQTTLVKSWGNFTTDSNGNVIESGNPDLVKIGNTTYFGPFPIYDTPIGVSCGFPYAVATGDNYGLYAPVRKLKDYEWSSANGIDLTYYGVDLATLNHVHEFNHTHQVTQVAHTHTGSGRLSLDPHIHPLKEGVKVSTTTPQNVILHINDEPYAVIDGSNPTANNVDISNNIKIGDWNVIKVTTSNLSRITIYGTIELILKY